MRLLKGQIQKIIDGAAGFLMLDATIHQRGPDTIGDDGDIVPGEWVHTPVSQLGFPDTKLEDYRAESLLKADERLLLLLQKPLIDAGITLEQDDEITMRGIRSKVLRLLEDPAQATFEVVVKP